MDLMAITKPDCPYIVLESVTRDHN
jgi:hypothetical protein